MGLVHALDLTVNEKKVAVYAPEGETINLVQDGDAIVVNGREVTAKHCKGGRVDVEAFDPESSCVV